MAEPFKNYDEFFERINHIKEDAAILRQLVRDTEPGTVIIDGEPRANVAKQIADTIERIETKVEAVLPELRAVEDAVASSAAAADDQADRSTTQADRATDAKNAAIAAINVHPDIAAGLAATASGEYFSVPASDDGLVLTLYRNDSGSETEIGSYPSAQAIERAASISIYALDLAGQAAAYASRDSASDKRINQLLQSIAYALDIASQTARAAPAAYLRALGAALHIDGQGRIGIGTNTPGAALDIAGGRLRLRTSQPPASSGAPGLPGEMAWDSNYEYRCVAANTWRRIPLQNW